MANLINLDAEVGANYIGDDAGPSLTVSNLSTGPGLKVHGLVLTSTASIDAATIGGPVLAAAATIANLNLRGASRASGAVFALKGDAFVSVTTIKATTGGVAGSGAIRIVLTDGTFGWIPVYPDGAVTAAAVA